MLPSINALRQLWRDLRAQRLRTALTVLGIVWGTVAVSLLLAFGEGMHRQLLKNQAGLGSGIIIAWPSQTSIPFEGLGKGRPIRLDEDDLAIVRARSREVALVSSEYQDTLRLAVGPTTLAVDTSGVHPAYAEMRNVIPEKGGRFIDALDVERRRRVVFLGDEIAEQLFGGEGAVGQTLRLNGAPFLVVGTMRPKVQESSYSGRDKDKVWIPATTMRSLTGQLVMDNLVFTPHDPQRSREATAEVRSILAGVHRFDPADKEAFGVWDTTEMGEFMDTFMMAFRIFLGVIGALTLVVGGIGVSNIMNVVVEERTREIGVKMALGARPRAVLGQFLVESLVVTAVGGVVGLAVAAALCAVFPALDMSRFVGTPVISPGVAALTAGLLGVIGTIAGYFPAAAGARMDPVVAMKR